MAPNDDDAEEGSSEDVLILIANIHYILAGLFVIVVIATVPILIGTLVGVSLIGTPGTGTPAAAKGPVLDYIRTTGPFPDSGPLFQIFGLIRNVGLVAVLFLTGVGLEKRLRSAWYATITFYGLVVVGSWPNPVGIIIGGLGLIALWSGREAINTDQRLSREVTILHTGIHEKITEIREIDIDA